MAEAFEKGGQGSKIERVTSGYFEQALDDLKFDPEGLKAEMYDALAKSQSNAYTLIKWEAKHSGDSKPITRAQFNDFVQINGGEAFLRQIFINGVKRLRRNFQLEPAKFKKYTDALSGRKSAYERVRFIDTRRKTIVKTRYEIMQGSRMLDDMKKIAEFLGKEAKDLTFDEAFDNGFYNEYFQPTVRGVAGYGLSWFEYKDKARRQKMESYLSRKKVGDKAAALLTPVQPADTKKEDAEKRFQEEARMKQDLIKVLGTDMEGFKKAGIELKFDSYEEGIRYPAVGFYKNGKLLFAVEMRFDDNDGRAIYILRDPRKDRDVEFVTKPDFKNLNDAVHMAWFIRRKIENPSHSEQELRDGLEAVTAVKGLRFYVTKEEAKKRGYIEFDEDTKTWKPIEGYRFLDKKKNSTNFAIEFDQNLQNRIKLDAAEAHDFISAQIDYYKQQGVEGLDVGVPQRDQFGNLWLALYKGNKLLFLLDVRYYDGEVVYDFKVDGDKVEFDNFPELRSRIGNFLKKNIKVDVEKAGRLAEKRRAESEMEVKTINEGFEGDINGFRKMMEVAYNELLVGGNFHGQAARVFYVTSGDNVYKFRFERTYKDGKFDLQVKIFAGTKYEKIFKSSQIRFEDIYQEGRRGERQRESFANELRKFFNDSEREMIGRRVDVNEYVVPIEEVEKVRESRDK